MSVGPRATIICNVDLSNESSTRFVWSDGPPFEPYELGTYASDRFRAKAREARRLLKALTTAHTKPDCADEVRTLSLELARAGYDLYQRMFQLGIDNPRESLATEVQEWLQRLESKDAIESIEVLFHGPPLVPWNVMYTEPLKDGANPSDPEFWRPFWGARHNLAVGRSVSPFRRLRVLDDPSVLAVLDEKVFGNLRREGKELRAYLKQNNITAVSTKAELVEKMRDAPPDLLYWFGHATPKHLRLGDEDISPDDIFDLFMSRRKRGIAFLNACQTGQQAEGPAFIDALLASGFTGLIATEELTLNTFANQFGLNFLRGFLGGQRGVAELVRSLRTTEEKGERGLPLGLLYTTYCPPWLQVGETKYLSQAPPPASDPAGGSDTTAGLEVLGAQAGAPRNQRKDIALPERPYPSLASYDRDQRALFTGREDDVDRFAELLDNADGSMVVIHGESGVGKSSFLRAGVIPFIEEDCAGYRFFRDRRKGRDQDAPILFVRSTANPVQQLAMALCRFCSTAISYANPLQQLVSIPLPDILRRKLGADPEARLLEERVLANPEMLPELLVELTATLPHALVIVIDQCEELFTLSELGANGPPSSASMTGERLRDRSIEVLRHLQRKRGNFRVILTLRTEYHGRLVGSIRDHGRNRPKIAEFFLDELKHDQLAKAIVRPTEFPEYDFKYAPGVPEEIASAILFATRGYRDSALPLLQVVCSQMFELRTPGKALDMESFRAVGGVSGGMRRHVEKLVAAVAAQHAPASPEPFAEAFRTLCTHLYLEQPDGTRTTALTSLESLETVWGSAKTTTPLSAVLATAVEMKLLRATPTPAQKNKEQILVSLGHDALAAVAAEWDRDAQNAVSLAEERAKVDAARASQRRSRAIAMGSVLVALGLGGFANWVSGQRQAAQEARALAEVQARQAEEHTRIAVTMLSDANESVDAANKAQQLAAAERQKTSVDLLELKAISDKLAAAVTKQQREEANRAFAEFVKARGLPTAPAPSNSSPSLPSPVLPKRPCGCPPNDAPCIMRCIEKR